MQIKRLGKALVSLVPVGLASCVVPGQDVFPGPGDDLPIVVSRDGLDTTFSMALCPGGDYVQALELSDGRTFATAIWSPDTVVTSDELRIVTITFGDEQVIDNSILAVEGLQPSDDGSLRGKDVTIIQATTYRGEAGFGIDDFVLDDGDAILVRGNPLAGGSAEPLIVPEADVFSSWCDEAPVDPSL